MKIPRIGIGVIVVRDNKLLLGKRLNSHGEGTWAFPGGHLEFGETPQKCAVRETLEETGLHLTEVKDAFWTCDIFEQEGKHYITLFISSQSKEGEPQLREPHKCSQWQWFEVDKLPQPLFLPLQNLLNDTTKKAQLYSLLQKE